MMIMDFEFAALSLDVYRRENRPPLPEGWSIFADYIPKPPYVLNDYFGSCYIKGYGDIYHVVFAHRGTDLTIPFNTYNLFHDLDTILNDIKAVFFEQTPLQYETALKFVQETTVLLNAKFGEDHCLINHTGHSAGAILAEIFSTTFEKFDVYRSIVSFESPGSKPIIQYMINNGKLPQNALEKAATVCTIFNANINIINTSNEQVRIPYLVRPYDFKYTINGRSPPLEPSREFYFNPYYVFDYSFSDQHAIEYIYDWLKADKESCTYPESYKYPVGFTQSYASYLYANYNGNFGIFGPNYWYDYIQEIWKTHPDIQVQFKNDFNAYRDNFVKTYLTSDSSLNKNSIVTNKPSNSYDKVSLKLTKFSNIIKEVKSDLDDDFVIINNNDLENEDASNEKSSACVIM